MKIEQLKGAAGSRKGPKRVGRGIGSGHGKTATKGHKGQKARSGGAKGAGFEGGQMPLQRRLPKRGFTSIFSVRYTVLNLSDLERLGMDSITPETLAERGTVKLKGPLKILGEGELKKSIKVKADAFSASAKKKIEAAGGTAEVI